jgi:uncharacterized protein GlcG (DUF336 family)
MVDACTAWAERNHATVAALPIVLDGEVIGSMGVSSADGEKCAQAPIDAVFNKQGTPLAP